MNKPLVSIITPSFNQGEYIEETIQSVLAQDYGNIEYVIVDGGSKDNTLRIIKKYSDRLKWISKKDEGQSDAIMKGIEMTSGEIIYWLNSDDVILPGVVKDVVEKFRENPKLNLVYGKSYFVDQCGRIIGNVPSEPYEYESFAYIDYIPQPSAFFKREDYKKVGGLEKKYHYAMDYDLFYRLAKLIKPFYANKYMSCYRLHTDSKTVNIKYALEFHKETIDIVVRNYGWAPANRVYAYSYFLTKSILGKAASRPINIICALCVSMIIYLKINKKIKVSDIRYVKWVNIKKLFVRWSDMYKMY